MGARADGSRVDRGPALQVLERGMRVLIELAQAPELGVSELSRTLGVNKSTVFRILATHKRLGFVVQNPITEKYHLGLRAFEVGSAVANRFGLLDQAAPEIERLFQEFNETVNLAALDGPEIIYLHKLESPEPLRLGLRIGTRVPAYASALGKAILADMSASELQAWIWRQVEDGRLVAYTPTTVSDPARLVKELAETRARGFSVDNEEFKPGIRCVAAPVHDHGGHTVAAISVAAPAIRLTMDQIHKVVGPAVAQAAARVSRNLGYGIYRAGHPLPSPAPGPDGLGPSGHADGGEGVSGRR